ncbi:hypothetical protein SISSUDRAFT_1125151 [Sistotremastrum suecicum HHB10207 ss-3]|uniref:Protein EFR3 n=1 Tax=Sistotremastrum suecicum HHB10207 ss-3 TaxID=1314776 RepID=A0A166HN39_9AGAM|nr:hypothetical protein SISSUDRAFT_1125151 [Sistotremastrum suecicum HHB10207 ss-3]
MLRILTPHHVTLISACYPSSAALATAAPDYVPNSQETSRLVYYASNRPGKLNKLGSELEKRARAEALRAAGGNSRARASLLITLALFKALTTECRRDLALLSHPLMQAVSVSVARLSTDLEVVARAASVLSAWCAYTDGILIGVDADLTSTYLDVVSRFCRLCTSNTKVEQDFEVRNRTRLIGLAAVTAVIESEALYRSTSEFPRQMNLIMPALIFNMRKVDMKILQTEAAAIKVKTQATPSPYMPDFRPRPLAERRAESIHAHIDGETGPSNADVVNACLRAYSTLLQRTAAIQIAQTLSSSLDEFDSSNVWSESDFCVWFGDKTTQWSQYQYRYTIPTRLLDRLLSIQENTKHPESRRVLLRMVTSVLSSETPLFNLSTSDLMSQLCTFALRRINVSYEDDLLPPAADCIAALATHVHYADQIQDLAQEIISKMAAIQIQGSSGRGRQAQTRDEGRIQSLRFLLASLHGLLQTACRHDIGPEHADGHAPLKERQSSDTAGVVAQPQDAPESRPARRTPIHPEIWQESLAILCETDYSVRADYSRELIHYIQKELPREDLEVIENGKDVSRNTLQVGSSAGRSDAVVRFLHAVHASAYSLATSSSLGLSTPPMPSPMPSVDENEESPNIQVEPPSSPPVEVTSPPEDGPSSHQPPPAPQRSPKARTLSVNLKLLDRPSFSVPPDGVAGSAVASDYTHLSKILVALHESVPVSSLLTGVPMLLALDAAVGAEKIDPLDLCHQRKLAIREMLLLCWASIGRIWKCPEVSQSAEKALASLHGASVLPNVSDRHPAWLQNPSQPVPFTSTQFDPSSPPHTIFSVNHELVLSALASSHLVQQATGLDRQSVLRSIASEWSMHLALKNSVESFAGRDLRRTEGSSPMKLSPALMHIENLSLASLTRSTRGVGVGDLKDALEGRASLSNPALVNGSSSTLEQPSSVHHELALRKTRSRPRAKPRPQKSGSNDVKDVLNRLGIGKQNGSSLLKASFPPLKRVTSKPSNVTPPYPT